MATESLKKAVAKYDKANTKQVHLKLNIKTDKDILEQLEKVDNKQGYIKALIRADIGSISRKYYELGKVMAKGYTEGLKEVE